MAHVQQFCWSHLAQEHLIQCCNWCRQLGWEAATERLLEAAEIHPMQQAGCVTRLGQSSLWGLYKWFLGEARLALVDAQPL